MNIRNRQSLTVALLFGTFLAANSVRAQDPAPKPAAGQAVGAHDDLADARYVAHYLGLLTQAKLADQGQNANFANDYFTLSDANDSSSIQRLALVHAGNNGCTACHSWNGSQIDPRKPEKLNASFTLADTLPTIFSVQNQSDSTLGATFQPIEDSVRTQLGLQEKSGLLVASLADEGAAAKAGLHRNDILLAIADTPLAEVADLPKTLKTVGEKVVSLKLVRSGKTLTIQVRPVTQMTLTAAEPQKASYYIGVSATPPDDVLRAHVTLPTGQGLLVNEVVAESPAEKCGVKKFDILLKIDDTPLDNRETLSTKVQAVGGKPAKLSILPSNKTITITVTPEPRKAETANSDPGQPVRFWTPLVNPHIIHSYKNVNYAAPVATTRFTTVQPTVAPAPADPSSLAKRLDDLDKEMKVIRKAIEEARDAVKKEK